MIFVELDICYVVCPKRPRNAREGIQQHRLIGHRILGDLNACDCSNIRMAITLRELALLQAEVLNAASWWLAPWQYQIKTGLADKRALVGCGRASVVAQHTPQQPRPPSSAIHRPFLHTLLLDTSPSFVSICPRLHTLYATLLLMLCIALAVRGRRRATNAPV